MSLFLIKSLFTLIRSYRKIIKKIVDFRRTLLKAVKIDESDDITSTIYKLNTKNLNTKHEDFKKALCSAYSNAPFGAEWRSVDENISYSDTTIMSDRLLTLSETIVK
jgi:hypothetical protein